MIIAAITKAEAHKAAAAPLMPDPADVLLFEGCWFMVAARKFMRQGVQFAGRLRAFISVAASAARLR
jgi:hypothetical protein